MCGSPSSFLGPFVYYVFDPLEFINIFSLFGGISSESEFRRRNIKEVTGLKDVRWRCRSDLTLTSWRFDFYWGWSVMAGESFLCQRKNYLVALCGFSAPLISRHCLEFVGAHGMFCCIEYIGIQAPMSSRFINDIWCVKDARWDVDFARIWISMGMARYFFSHVPLI